MAGYYSGQYVSNFNRFNKLYRVMIQSSPEYRVAPESLDKIFTRTGSGEAAPGYSSGDAIRAIREVAASNLPRGTALSSPASAAKRARRRATRPSSS